MEWSGAKEVLGAAAVVVLAFLSILSVHSFLTSFLKSLSVRVDKEVIGKPEDVRALDVSFEDKRALIRYVLLYPEGRRVKRRAELRWKGGRWLVNRI